MAVSLVPAKGSECFLPRSHQCLHSHSLLGLRLCHCMQQQQEAIHAPEGFWQRLAIVQPATYWESVLLPDTSDPYSLLGHQLRTLRSAPGIIMVEDCKTISCNFYIGVCCCALIMAPMAVSHTNACWASPLQVSEPAGRKVMASCYEMGTEAVARAGRRCQS